MHICSHLWETQGFAGGSVVKNPPAYAGDAGSIPELGRSLGGGNGNSFQYSCLGNPMDRGTWQATMFRRSYFLFCVSFNRGKLCSGSQLNFSPVLSIIIRSYACICVLAQLCPTLCKPVDCSPPGSSDHGIFQARILEWVAISSSRGSSWPREWTASLVSPALAGGSTE